MSATTQTAAAGLTPEQLAERMVEIRKTALVGSRRWAVYVIGTDGKLHRQGKYGRALDKGEADAHARFYREHLAAIIRSADQMRAAAKGGA